MTAIKPLLACPADLDKITYPVLVTPKLDGIRCLRHEGTALSRKMKPIPNKYIQEELAELEDGSDGELMLLSDQYLFNSEGRIGHDFNSVQSAVMSQDGEPNFVFVVFDNFLADGGYRERVASLGKISHPRVKILQPSLVNTEEELLILLEAYLEKGYEGAMIRDPGGKYKHGRSTIREGILLKLKVFHDDEGVLVDIVEKMHNNNTLEKDELGYAKRSSKKENLTPAGTAGSLVVEWNGLQFHVGFGPGITDAIKQEWWDKREDLKGKFLKFKYQELSKDGVPRFGKALGFRHEDDMGEV